MDPQTQKLVDAITKALGYTENGGKPNLNNLKAGKTGEMKSLFQFTPATWKNYSQQVFGKDVPISADAETYVVQQKVGKWVDKLSQEGYSQDKIVPMIASMWNAGAGEPDAYTGKFSDGSPSSGVNAKYGVKYDVPSYAKKVTKYTDQFLTQNDPQEQSGNQAQHQTQQVAQNPGNQASVAKLMTIIQQAKSNQQGPQAPQVATVTPQPNISQPQANNGLMGGLIKGMS